MNIKSLVFYLSLILLLSFSTNSSSQISCTGGLSVRVSGADLPMQVDFIKSDLYCSGAGDGYIKILAIGGTPPYHFSWSDGSDEQERQDLAAGIYTVTVNDSNNCIDTMSINLSQMYPGSSANGGNDLLLADKYGCGACYLRDGQNTFIYQDIDYMLHITDIFDGVDLQNVEVCLDLYPKSLQFGDRMLMRRYWAIKSSKAEARTRLYFRESEFTELAIESGYKALIEIIDTADINIKVFKGGISTYDNYDVVTTIPRKDFKISRSNVANDIWVATFSYNDFEPNAYTGFYLDIPYVNVSTATEEVAAVDSSDFYLLQNPVLSVTHLTNDNFDDFVDGTIKILDIDGRLLHIEDFENDNLKAYRIPVEDFPSGAYVYVIEIPELKMQKSIKFIKI